MLGHWYGRGVKGKTLVCFDAHLDVQFIAADRIQRLLDAESVVQVERLAKPHHLFPEQGFSYSIEDFLYAAFRLGIIERLVWVAPPHVSIEHSASSIDELTQMKGVALADAHSFRLIAPGASDAIAGQLLGLPITICRHNDLARLNLPTDTLIDIDIDYFVSLPGDQLGTDPAVIAATLDALPLNDPQRTISLSYHSGFLPHRFRPLASDLVRHWTGRSVTLPDVPNCPTQKACAVAARMLDVSLDTVMQWAMESQQIDGRVVGLNGSAETQQAITATAFGLLWVELRRVDRAMHCYQIAAQGLGYQGELALEIGKALCDLDQHRRAIEFLADATRDDKTCAAAWYFGAIAHHSLCLHQEAIQWAERAHHETPLWSAPMSLLSDLYQQTGDRERAAAFVQKNKSTRAAITATT
ncbi:hypothetical protein Pla52n_44840 [Stieleria varia]|uniref:Tetratricopeptide repeat protein n=1 Tax=Stieleria varia TaxID=2528005 RepID=A0A5C6AQ53_9BACT|nr:hypothetical protein Pla52n_44840 [Stieleria varia]